MRASSKSTETDITPLQHPRFTLTPIGHDNHCQLLDQLAKSDQTPHAWLFSGPRGIGKATLAYFFARKLLTYGASGMFAPTEDELFQRIANNSHPDLTTLELSDDKKAINVDEIRTILHQMRHTPYESSRRIVIIDHVEAMNLNATNALLKILEEPPAHAIFILISHSCAVLPTIRSRCLQLSVTPPTAEQALSILQQQLPDLGEKESTIALEMAGYSPGEAYQLITYDAVSLYQQIIDYFIKISQTTTAEFQHPLMKQLDNPCLISMINLVFNRLIKQQAGIRLATECFDNEFEQLSILMQCQSPDRWIRINHYVRELLQDSQRIHLDKHAIFRALPSIMAKSVA